MKIQKSLTSNWRTFRWPSPAAMCSELGPSNPVRLSIHPFKSKSSSWPAWTRASWRRKGNLWKHPKIAKLGVVVGSIDANRIQSRKSFCQRHMLTRTIWSLPVRAKKCRTVSSFLFVSWRCSLVARCRRRRKQVRCWFDAARHSGVIPSTSWQRKSEKKESTRNNVCQSCQGGASPWD